MPELPEVETVRRKMERALKGQRIVGLRYERQDRFLFAEVAAADVEKALVGARVTGSGRKGKYFWLALDRKPWPVFHLGMTGNVDIRRAGKRAHDASWGGVRLWGEGGRKEGEGRGRLWFARLLLEAENGTELALTDPRRFGRMWLADAPLLLPRIKKLGFDPLQKFPAAKELALILKKRRAPIKAVLLDQALFAGVGNWIADEILFQARLSPHRLAASLTAPEVARLRAKTLSIIKKAVAVQADYERFPRTWLFHHRWGKKADAMAYGKKKIRHDEVGGRTTAWVPALQK